MRAVTPHIYEIDTEAFGQEKIVASYLIKGKDKTALVDPGFPSSAPIIKEKLKNNGFDPANIDYVLLTHFHLDHSGGTGAILKDSPKAKVVIHKRAAFYIRNFAKVVGGARMVFRPEIIKKFGMAYDVPHDSVVPVTDGETIDLGGGVRVRVIHTPGHCPDEVSFFEESSGAMITGDMACLQYPAFNYVPIPAGSPPIFDLAEEVASLEALRSIQAGRILLPHYGELQGSWKDFIDNSIEAIENTRNKINGMFKENIEFQQMVERLRADLIRASGKRIEDVPAFLSEVYIREMLKTGLMGFFAYLLEYAPYPRSFSYEACTVGISQEE
ncbi:MAG: MBL fold metallo-hydrolase [Nitrospirota bacterium]